MVDLDIAQKIEQEKAREKAHLEKKREQAIEMEKSEPVLSEEDTRSEFKTVLVMLAILLGLFALTFGGYTFYQGMTSAAVVSVDELHQKNLDHKLNTEEGYIYNGFSFVKVDGLWWTELNKFGTRLKIPLHFGPRELENVTISGTLNSSFNDPEDVFVAIDPLVRDKYYTLAVSELSFNMVKGMDRAPIGSCTRNESGCDNRTIISCDNAKGRAVIELALGEKSKVELKDTCIKVSGNQFDLVRAVDRILYQWYGIMS
jgi:hypothetical protein